MCVFLLPEPQFPYLYGEGAGVEALRGLSYSKCSGTIRASISGTFSLISFTKLYPHTASWAKDAGLHQHLALGRLGAVGAVFTRPRGKWVNVCLFRAMWVSQGGNKQLCLGMVTVKAWEGSPSFVCPNLLESLENPSPISADPLIPFSGQRVVQDWLFSHSWDLGE